MTSVKNTAIVHDWLVSMRGGEKVLETLCELFPESSLYTLIHLQGQMSPKIEAMEIRTSFIQHLPFAGSRYQYYLPLFPRAIEKFDLCDYDLVLSSSHAVAKGVRVRDDALHICYCHTPMRYIWDQYDQYFGKGQGSLIARTGMAVFLNYLRRWDVKSSGNVDYFLANSRTVQERIKRIYNRDSEVIYPPVDIERFSLSIRNDGYFLIVSALVPYKRIDLAVEAFNQLGEPLIIVGSGREMSRLKARAKRNIEFTDWVSNKKIEEYYARCCALVFPGEEDFGIVPVEAMSCGKPVVAYGKGGVCETVAEGETGIFFNQPTVESLTQAIKKFKGTEFNASAIRKSVYKFSKDLFKRRLMAFIDQYSKG